MGIAIVPLLGKKIVIRRFLLKDCTGRIIINSAENSSNINFITEAFKKKDKKPSTRSPEWMFELAAIQLSDIDLHLSLISSNTDLKIKAGAIKISGNSFSLQNLDFRNDNILIWNTEVILINSSKEESQVENVDEQQSAVFFLSDVVKIKNSSFSMQNELAQNIIEMGTEGLQLKSVSVDLEKFLFGCSEIEIDNSFLKNSSTPPGDTNKATGEIALDSSEKQNLISFENLNVSDIISNFETIIRLPPKQLLVLAYLMAIQMFCRI